MTGTLPKGFDSNGNFRTKKDYSGTVLVIVVAAALIGIGILLIVMFHDVYVFNNKEQKQYDDALNNSSCSDLKYTISFFNKLDEGQWIKTDLSREQKRLQELNCK